MITLAFGVDVRDVDRAYAMRKRAVAVTDNVVAEVRLIALEKLRVRRLGRVEWRTVLVAQLLRVRPRQSVIAREPPEALVVVDAREIGFAAAKSRPSDPQPDQKTSDRSPSTRCTCPRATLYPESARTPTMSAVILRSSAHGLFRFIADRLPRVNLFALESRADVADPDQNCGPFLRMLRVQFARTRPQCASLAPLQTPCMKPARPCLHNTRASWQPYLLAAPSERFDAPPPNRDYPHSILPAAIQQPMNR